MMNGIQEERKIAMDVAFNFFNIREARIQKVGSTRKKASEVELKVAFKLLEL